MAAKNETLHAKKRDVAGTKACRRLREAGDIPAVVYGHKEDAVPIQVSAEELDQALRSRSRMFDLRIGRKKESVLLKAIQHDAFGDVIIHADFVRVAMDEAIEIEVPIALKGAPKVEHAVLQQTLDALKIECLPGDIPERILCLVAALQVGDSVTVADLQVPAGVKVLTDPEVVVATLSPAVAAEAAIEEAAAAAAAEPEVIGRKPDEEGEAGEEKE
ncbi:MAG: 50S ribosomal protein L25 [Planctomycetes bacterium]|nr:50S ribosomal protein L25 [Planctomycetota bacterium]